MAKSDWKNSLLKSGLPLENDVARLLARKDFAVTSEYIFSRNDMGVAKDFSIDIEATKYFSKNRGPREILLGRLHTLVECKYRAPNTKWIFAPDQNDGGFSPITLGGTLQIFDQISKININPNATVPFDDKVHFALRGVEIGHSSEGYDAEIRRGLSQLQYGLARLLHDLISFTSGSHPDDRDPFFIAPILLTTAEIRMINPHITLTDMLSADELDEVSHRVDYCVAYRDFGPDFEQHCAATFKGIYSNMPKTLLSELDAKAGRHKYSHLLSEILKGLEGTERFFLRKYFNQFIICNYACFEKLIDDICKIVRKSLLKAHAA
jgi:hypothetical protein